MNVIETPLAGVLLITPRAFGDARGFFLETYQADRYAEAGIHAAFVQDNHSRSSRGVLRGLHYQIGRPQGKLVMVTRGAVFDVAVDIRKGSSTFGRWYGVELSDANHMQLYVPPGFAHGFCVLSETADFLYKCTEYYAPEAERAIIWNDPNIGIDWPIVEPSLSAKDAAAPQLKDVPSEDLF
ncbi:dTDP-4-dehydrorhamnose 3,5-epimerase [Desulfonatronum parangueonense]